MEDYKIPQGLKQLRKASGLSAKEVSEKLKKYNIDISFNTLYGYESGLSMPNADTFVALCKVYKCDNILDIFKSDSDRPNYVEWNLIKNYRSLDPHGKEAVDSILSIEMKRMRQLKPEAEIIGMELGKEHDKSKESTAFQDKLQTLKAAHNDFADDEEEQKLIREDLEDMENNW